VRTLPRPSATPVRDVPKRRRHFLAPIATPAVTLFIRLKIPATAITLVSVPLGLLAAYALAVRAYTPALLLIIIAGGADAVDGEVARRTGRTSRAGGYLDSLTDRIVDALLIIGLAWGADESRSWIAWMIALFGALTTSAAKWRIAEVLPVSDTVWGRDLVERTDRFLLILGGVGVAAFLAPTGHALIGVFILLVVLAVVTNITVAQRVLKAWRLLRAEDAAARALPVPGDPAAGTKDPKD
jgi:archaetidylinositol phosphate synthase